MIKGVNKQVVVVKCGGDVFEQAIFILKPQKYSDGKTIAAEAQKIIEEKTSLFGKKQRKATRDRRKKLINKLFEED